MVKGEQKINSATLFPHQVVKSLSDDEVIANAQWSSLPNYIPENSSVLPMIDLSGSMSTEAAKGYTCMDVAIALGLYTSTKNTGVFQNLWLNFSSSPQMYTLKGTTLQEYYNSLDFKNWGMNTDITKAFELILKVALENNLTQEQLPSTLMIFSDMQFDQALQGQSSFDTARVLFEHHNYKLPTVVFWNLNSKYQNSPCTQHESGAVLVSGFSPSVMEVVLSGDFEQITPENLMLKVLNKDRYLF